MKFFPIAKVQLNGLDLTFDVPPQLINSRTMVPMRKIFEELGALVEWNEETQTIIAVKDDNVIIMQIGSDIITVNGEKVALDSPPTIIEGNTLVPIRAVAESFNADVQWEEESQIVIITTIVSD